MEEIIRIAAHERAGETDQSARAAVEHPQVVPLRCLLCHLVPYALAGLWEKWKDRRSTTGCLSSSPEHDYDRWLKADPERPPIDLLRPYDADKMTAWKVDKAVGDVKNDSPELIEHASAAPEWSGLF